MVIALHLMIFLGALFDVALSQSYSWKNAEIGGGGFVTGAIFHPTESGLVYARTDVGGAYRLDAAANRWIPLNDDIGGLNNEFQHLGVLSIGLDPTDPDRLYIATGQYGGSESWKLPSRIYRSSNRGATWDGYVVPGFKMAGNGEGRGSGERFAINPANSNVILLGTSDAGIWRSIDRGVTWARLSGFPSGITSLNFVIYSPTNVSGSGSARRVYAAGRTLTTASLWYSDDNGDTWLEAPAQPGRIAGQEMFALMGAFDAAGTFYVTWGDQTGPSSYQTRYLVAKLAAGSSTWSTITPPTGQGGFAGISADPRVAGHVVVTTLHRWWPGDEVYRSTNGGLTWSAVLRSNGTTRSFGSSPWSSVIGCHWMTDIDIDPFNSDRVLFNTGFGLFQTSNLSATDSSPIWTFYNSGLEELVPLSLYSPGVGPALVAAAGDYTGFRLDNLNRSPRRGALAPMNGSNGYIVGAAQNSQRMIRQHSSDSLLSSDAGATWTRFTVTPPSVINGHNRIAFSADGNTLLWAPSGSGAYVSSDSGATWGVSTASSVKTDSSSTLTVATLAGSLGVAGANNATGSSATFSSPEGVAVAPDGKRYVADSGNHLIRLIGPGGAVTTLAGGSGSAGAIDASGASARFNTPTGIAFGNGVLYVADTGNHLIRQVTSAGVVTTIAGGAGVSGAVDASGTSARFNSPRGIAVDSSGNLYVADTGNHVVRKISNTGTVTTLAGLAGSPGSTNGVGAAARFSSPRGITVDASGIVYVADTDNHTIRRIAADGTVSTFAGSAGAAGSTNGTGAAARFSSPRGIAIDATGVIHVADTGNHVIRRISGSAVVSTVAGSAGVLGAVDGANTAARFNSPTGIAVQSDGFYLYCADKSNHAIRRMTACLTTVPLADSVDSDRFYLWSASARTLLTSVNRGVSFTISSSTLPSTLQQIRPVPGKLGHLWARAGTDGLYQSSNYGASFSKLSSVTEVYQFDFGKSAPAATYPAIFIWGKVAGVVGFFRSDNAGSSWVRINSNLQQFGYINDMAGDPRVYGRVYLGTSGRGVVVGELVPASAPASQSSALVYGDALEAGWNNASSSGVDMSATITMRRGSKAVMVSSQTASNASSFSVTTVARSTVGLGALSFWVSAGETSAPPLLRVGASRGGVLLEAYPIATPTGTGWQRVVVPLADLGIDNIDDLTGLRIESYTNTTTAPGGFYLDDIALLGTTDDSTATQINIAGLTVSYDGTPKPVTVTTIPAGRSVVVTYDGSPTPPSAVGSYTVVATLNDPFAVGSATAKLKIGDSSATIQFTSLSANADGTPKLPGIITSPPGLSYSLTYDGSTTAPTLAGRYNVVATITDPIYFGSVSATFVIRQPSMAATELTGWNSNVAGKLSAAGTGSPLLTPDDTSDAFSTNTLHASFPSVRLLYAGDTLTLTGSFQLTADGIANQGSWFRFGLFDNQGQNANTITGWLGGCSIGAAYYERTSSAGLFSTGSGATARTPDASPALVSLNSPAARPAVAFTATATRTSSGVIHGFQLRRLDTNALLLSYNYTDSSPNNNGLLTGSVTNASGYIPLYNTFGLAFARSYIGSSGALAQFSNIRMAFSPGTSPQDQVIDFPTPTDRPFNSAPFALSATASSGLPVSFSVVSGPATVSGSTLTLTGMGPVTVRATQAGNANFEAALPVVRTFVSTKLSASIAWSGLVASYDGSIKQPSVTTTPAGLGVTLNYNGDPLPPASVGSYAVSASINDSTYQGQATATFVIQPGPQSISFPAQSSVAVGTSYDPGATASSGLPVMYEVVSGPAQVNGNVVSVLGIGPIVLRATQDGNRSYLAASAVERTLTGVPGAATVTLSGLAAMYDGQPKPVSTTTVPAGLAVTVTYNGVATVPSAPGTYAVSATINDPRYVGSAVGNLVIGPRISASSVVGWRVTNSTQIQGANTDSPLLNASNGAGTAGASVPFYAFFDPVTLNQVGDSLRVSGSATVNAPGGTSGAGLWFRFGLYDNRNQASNVVMNWLGYTAMANTSASGSLHEKIGNQGQGDFGSSFFGTVSRTVDASPAYVGANAPSGVVTLNFEQTITRNASSVTVVSRVVKPGINGSAETVYLSSTYTDATPNNNGLVTGDQSTPLVTNYSPRYNAVGLVLSGAYIGSTNTSSVQFSNVTLQYTTNSTQTAPTINFPAIVNQSYSETPLSLSATSSSGQPVTFSVVSGPATLSGNNLTLTGTGLVTIRASQNGTLTTLPAAPIERSFEVVKAVAGLTLEGLLTTYDGSPKTVIARTVPAGLSVAITYDYQQIAPSAVGSYAVVATIDDPRYVGEMAGTLVVKSMTQVIDFAPLPDRRFGDSPIRLQATSSSGLPVELSIVSGPAQLTDQELTMTGAGLVTVRASQNGDAIYDPAPAVERVFRVEKGAAALALNGLTALYDGQAKPITVNTIPTGLDVIVTYNGSSTAPIAAGTYAVVATVNDLNYSGSVSGSLLITSPLVVPSVTFERMGGNYQLSLPSLLGYRYQLQCATDLSLNDWQQLGAAREGTGSLLVFTDPASPLMKRRFYRVAITPASP